MGNAASAELASTAAELKSRALRQEEEGVMVERMLPPTPSKTMDIFADLSPTDIRAMRTNQPRNLALLLRAAVGVCVTAVDAPTEAHLSRATHAVRLLTRIIPILLEASGDAAGSGAAVFGAAVLWENKVPALPAAQPPDLAHPPAQGGDASVPAPAPPPITWVAATEEGTTPLGVQLVHAAMGLLFAPGFTVDATLHEAFLGRVRATRAAALATIAQREVLPRVTSGEGAPPAAPIPNPGAEGGDAAAAAGSPPTTTATGNDVEEDARDGGVADAGGGGGAPAVVPDESNAVWPMLLWSGGIGFPHIANRSSTSTQLENRIDVLRLLLALCSGPLFVSPDPTTPARSRFLDELTGGNCPFAPTLFYSLVNAVLQYDPVGWGVPYATALVGDSEAPYVATVLQVLAVLLDYAPLVALPTSPPATTTPGPSGQAPMALFAQFNLYRSLLAGLTDAADFKLLYDGVTRQLGSVPYSSSTVLPFSVNQLECVPELLVVLWKLLDENAAFTQWVLASSDVTQLTTPLLYFLWQSRSDVTKVGLVHICTFMLLLLSGDRAFGVALNKPFNTKLPLDLPLFTGSHADLAIITLHKMVVDGSPKLAVLYSCFMTIIVNISPYLKGTCLLAATKLVNLFELFTTPRFLFARPGNYSFCQLLLEAMNNVLQYQYEPNGVLVYTLIRRREVFDRVVRLNYDQWRLYEDAKAAKKEGKAVTDVATVTLGGKEESPAAVTLHAGGTGLIAGAGDDVATGGGVDGAPRSEGLGAAAGVRHPDIAPASTPAHSPSTSPAVGAPAPPATSEAIVATPLQPSTPALPTTTPPPAAAVAAVAPGEEWVPTQAWWESVLHQLPFGTILRAVAYLQPLVEGKVAAAEGAMDDEAVIAFIKTTTIVGVVPVPHPILMRKYQPNQYTALWFTTFLWSTIFLHVCHDVPMFDAAAIKLYHFTVVSSA